MNSQIKKFAKESKLEIYGLGHDREKWEHCLSEFANLIVEECAVKCWSVSELEHKGYVVSECAKQIRKHFGIE